MATLPDLTTVDVSKLSGEELRNLFAKCTAGAPGPAQPAAYPLPSPPSGYYPPGPACGGHPAATLRNTPPASDAAGPGYAAYPGVAHAEFPPAQAGYGYPQQPQADVYPAGMPGGMQAMPPTMPGMPAPGPGSGFSDYSVNAALDASRQRRAALGGDLQARLDAQRQQNAAQFEELQRISRGVDICILMDCTGSMGNCIDAMKQKCMEIYQRAAEMHQGTAVRVAFVGYRDWGIEAGDGQYVVQDFVDSSEAYRLHSLLTMVRACGGGNAEDVAGGLKQAVELNWQSSTRLLIHFCDAPCHGDQYHGGWAVNGPDSYPAGDPSGLVPELLLQELIAKRCDYYFCRLCTHTDRMMEIFADVFAGANAVFDVLDCNSPADSFIPLIVKSVSASMARRGGRVAPAYTTANQRMLAELPAGLGY